mgnify:CR=1 FL=1
MISRRTLLVALIAFLAAIAGVFAGRMVASPEPPSETELHALLHNKLKLAPTQQDKIEALDAGADDYVTKPIDREVLQRTLEKWDCKPFVSTANVPSVQETQEIALVPQLEPPPHFLAAHK